jgi:hypothetical protein
MSLPTHLGHTSVQVLVQTTEIRSGIHAKAVDASNMPSSTMPSSTILRDPCVGGGDFFGDRCNVLAQA